MKNIVSIFALIALLISCNNPKNKEVTAVTDSESTTYYLIRHAEKDRSDPTNKNPELTPKGIERAMKWAQYFDDKKIDQIYSTDYNRTMQTAAYTASKKQLLVETYDPSDLFNEDFKTLTKGGNVLVVGHSNTTPQFVNAIIGEDKYTDIDDNENGLLFMVTVIDDDTNVQLFTVN